MDIKKNPLSIAFGIFLNEERKKISGSSIEEFLKKLDSGKVLEEDSSYSESLYRLVEGGNARIHPKHLFQYIGAFYGSNIKFEPFCQLIIAIQFLDSYLGNYDKFTKAYKYLKDSGNSKYEYLLETVEPYIKYLHKNNSGIKEKMITGGVIEKLRQFLSSNTYEDFGKPAPEVQELKIFREFPTMYYGIIDQFVKSLIALPISVKAKMLWAWEDKNENNIEYLYAVSKSIESIISEENFSRYEYRYLLSPDSIFKEAHIVFLTKGDEIELKSEFCLKLKAGLKEKIDELYLIDFESKMEKVHIYCRNLSSSDSQAIFDDADTSDPAKTENYNLAWAFKLRDNINVGFKGLIGKNNELKEALNLTWDKTTTLLDQIKKLI